MIRMPSPIPLSAIRVQEYRTQNDVQITHKVRFCSNTDAPNSKNKVIST